MRVLARRRRQHAARAAATGPSSTGSTSSTLARSTCSGAPLGGGQMFGQSAPASESRTRWPGSKIHEVASSSISISVGTPGSSATGASWPSRCVRLSRPRQARAEVPSGKTSQSLAETYATGTGEVTVSRTRGWPITSSSAAERLPVVGEREGVVGALVVGQSPRELPGARDPGHLADIATDVDRVGAFAIGAQHLLGEPLRRPGRLAAPLAAHLGAIGRRHASSGGRTPRSAAPRRRRSARRRASGGTSGSAPGRDRCAAPAARWRSSRAPRGRGSRASGRTAPRSRGRRCSCSRRPSRPRSSSRT